LPANKTVPAPVGRFDEPRRIRIVVQSLADLLDTGFEYALRDEGIAPNRVQHFTLGDEAPRILSEVAK
jgi:hypothetical protein